MQGDVISAHEVGMKGKADEEQLHYAIENKRTFVTFNARHFAPLAKKIFEEQRDHFWIVISKQVNLSEIIKLVVRMLKVCKTDNLKKPLMWAAVWKEVYH